MTSILQVIGTWDLEKKARLLQFTTGTSRIPVNGSVPIPLPPPSHSPSVTLSLSHSSLPHPSLPRAHAHPKARS